MHHAVILENSDRTTSHVAITQGLKCIISTSNADNIP